MSDYRFENLTRLVEEVSKINDTITSLENQIESLNIKAQKDVREIEEILEYHGIKGSYVRAEKKGVN